MFLLFGFEQLKAERCEYLCAHQCGREAFVYFVEREGQVNDQDRMNQLYQRKDLLEHLQRQLIQQDLINNCNKSLAKSGVDNIQAFEQYQLAWIYNKLNSSLTVSPMEIIGSVFNIYSNLTETDESCRTTIEKLQYLIKKVDYALDRDQLKSAPDFMIKNLQKKYKQAVDGLLNIRNFMKENSISITDKVRLNMPGNKTIAQAKKAFEELNDAFMEIQSHAGSNSEIGTGKRTVKQLSIQDYNDNKGQSKNKPLSITAIQNSQIDDDIQEALMGPTIEEDAAIEVCRNQSIEINVELNGEPKLIERLKKVCPKLMKYSQKIDIKFQQKDKHGTSQMNIFSFGRTYFKKVFEEVKQIFPDVNRISKKNHFDVVLRRTTIKDTQNLPNQYQSQQLSKKQQKQTTSTNEGEIKKQANQSEGDQFFSFPVTEQKAQTVMRQVTEVWVKSEKSVYLAYPTGQKWTKIDEEGSSLSSGDLIAMFLPEGVPIFYLKFDYNLHQ